MAYRKRHKAAFVVPMLFLLLGGEVRAASSEHPTLSKFLSICESSTFSDASAKGDALGWKRLINEKLRQTFSTYKLGPLEEVRWQNPNDEIEFIGLEIKKEQSPSKVCQYSTSRP